MQEAVFILKHFYNLKLNNKQQFLIQEASRHDTESIYFSRF